MFVLDISKANGASMSDLEKSWRIEALFTADVNTGKRRDCQYAVIGTQLVISGGVSGTNSSIPMDHQTIAYDVQDKLWKKYPNYEDGIFGNRQM
jgi:hypothetical protein